MNSEGQVDYLDQIYNITSTRDDYVNPMTERKLNWHSVSSCTLNSGEALENKKKRLHEVSMRRLARITQSVRQVGREESEISTYEGLPNLTYFLTKFEDKVVEH